MIVIFHPRSDEFSALYLVKGTLRQNLGIICHSSSDKSYVFDILSTAKIQLGVNFRSQNNSYQIWLNNHTKNKVEFLFLVDCIYG